MSLDVIREIFRVGKATRAQYADALKGYGEAVAETMSHERDRAKLLNAAIRDSPK